MTVGNLICGMLSSLLTTILIAIVTKIYLGISKFRGVKESIRLLRDCYEGGIINIFPNRRTYVRHKDHGTESQYISKCTSKLMYIGYWLAHGTEMGDIIETLRKLILERKEVEVILLNPNNNSLIKEMADYLKIDCKEMKQRINYSLAKIYKMREELPEDVRMYFQIKIHNVPLNASAFMINYDKKEEIRILIDYKTYHHTREDSYGIEFLDANKVITKNIYDSYMQISKKAILYEQRK